MPVGARLLGLRVTCNAGWGAAAAGARDPGERDAMALALLGSL